MMPSTAPSSLAPRTIVSIQPDTKHAALVRVCIGPPKRRVGTLHARDIERLQLVVGTPWTPVLQAAVEDAALLTAARRRAHRWINQRPLSRAALIERLTKAGYDAELCERLVRELEDVGLIDDAAYAKAIVKHERSRKPIGEQLLRQKFSARGISNDTAEQAIRQHTTERTSTPLDDALSLARTTLDKLERSHALDASVKARRIFGVLARRGFEEHVAEEAVRILLGCDLDE